MKTSRPMKAFMLIAGLVATCRVAQAWTTNDINLILAEFPSNTTHQFQMMPMRDGTRLATHFFLPAGYAATNFPVVMMRSAYNSWQQKTGYADDLVNQTDTNHFRWLNTNGYVFVVQDLRGDGDSETNATFEPRLSDNEINDAYDAVETIATNSWCGRIGMFGGSGHGMAVFNAWFSRAPHLTVVAPNNTGPSLYKFWSFENGVRRWIYDWLSNRNTSLSDWPKPTLGNYYSNEQWQSVLQGAESNNPAILLLTGDAWHNFFLNSTFDVFEHAAANTNNKVFMEVKAGAHGEAYGLQFPNASGVSAISQVPGMLKILDGAAVTNKSFLEYYVMGDALNAGAQGNFRRIATSWPVTNISHSYYMQADGFLSRFAPTQALASLAYSYHPTNPVTTVGGGFSYGNTGDSLPGSLNQLVPQLTNRNDILRFESSPLSRPLELNGKIWADLYISTDVEDTTFMVKLIDIYPNTGTNAYQAIMRESAIMARYWGGFTNPAPLVSGTVYRLQIDMSTLGLMFEKGHRIGVHITSSSAPAYEVHPNTYVQVSSYSSSPTAHQQIYFCTGYPSRIILPILDNVWTNPVALQTDVAATNIPEGAQGQIGIKLSDETLNAVTVTVAHVSGSTNIQLSGSTSFIFNERNWFQTQYVAVVSVEDADKISETAVLRCSSASAAITNSVDVTVYSPDNELSVLQLSTNVLNVGEGSTGDFSMRLAQAPAALVTVTVSRISGDADVTVSGGATNIFNGSNWSSWQTVTVAAGQDADGQADAAVLQCDSPDLMAPEQVAVSVTDNDTVARRWLVDCGGPAYLSTGNWNNVSNVTAGSAASNMVTEAGEGTGLSLTIRKAFGAVGGGITAANARYPVAAVRDSIAVRSNSTGRLLLAGMDTNAAYDIDFFSAFAGTSNYQMEVYAVRGGVTNASLYLNGANNLTQTVVMAGVTSWTNGTLEFVVKPGPENNNPVALYTYLNVVDIREIAQGAAVPDADGDGLPDAWETQYFGGATNANASAIAANGVNTILQTYIAGLNPTNPASVLLISDLRSLTSGNTLQWQGISGRVYSVYWSSNLLNGFQSLESNVPWTGNIFTDAVHGTANEGFYQIKVRLE